MKARDRWPPSSPVPGPEEEPKWISGLEPTRRSPHTDHSPSTAGCSRFLFLCPSPHDSISTSLLISPYLSYASFHTLTKASLGILFLSPCCDSLYATVIPRYQGCCSHRLAG